MNNCKDKISTICETRVSSACVDYQGDLSTCTTLNKDCKTYTVFEILEDINSQLSTICDKLDLSTLDADCLEYDKPVEELEIIDVLKKLTEEVCALKDNLPQTGECNPFFFMPIDCADLDYKCLIDACGVTIVPKNIMELLQAMINKMCSTDSE